MQVHLRAGALRDADRRHAQALPALHHMREVGAQVVLCRPFGEKVYGPAKPIVCRCGCGYVFQVRPVVA